MSIDRVPETLRTPADYREAARQIQAQPPAGLRPVRVAFLATFTATPLAPYVVVESARRGLYVSTWFGPYNQIEQQCLAPDSELYAFQPDVVVIATRLEELAPRRIDAEWHGAVARLRAVTAAVRANSKATVLLFNFAEPLIAPAGLAGASLDPSPSAILQQANAALAKAGREQPGVFLFDCARLMIEIGLERWHDPKLNYVGRIPFGVTAQIALGRRLARYLHAMYRTPCKCLVLDLDDTLWGGILGEAGPGGIALGEDYPGNAYRDFQRAVLALRDRGILLAIASKNNEDEVRAAWESLRPVLQWDDFAARQIHWEDKAGSLRAIAKSLSIGLDALAFYDDNPIEREWIRSQLPEVTVIDVPADPLARIAALEESGAFDQLTLTAEDQQRAAQYQDEHRREQLRSAALSLAEFLEQLQIQTELAPVTAETLPRVTQLINKTNQFNLTGRRYTAAELQSLLDSGAIACSVSVTDRFGDYGLVGAAFAVPESNGCWRLDNFVLSCRALGRGVEGALLAGIARLARERGARCLIGEYRPSGRNVVVKDFYPSHGFQARAEALLEWEFDLAVGDIATPKLVSTRLA